MDPWFLLRQSFILGTVHYSQRGWYRREMGWVNKIFPPINTKCFKFKILNLIINIIGMIHFTFSAYIVSSLSSFIQNIYSITFTIYIARHLSRVSMWSWAKYSLTWKLLSRCVFCHHLSCERRFIGLKSISLQYQPQCE